MRHIGVFNKSTVMTDAELHPIMEAVQAQVNDDLSTVWPTGGVQLLPNATVPWSIHVLDNSDQAGALGYHDLLAKAHDPTAMVFAETCKKYGASVSVCFSHEMLEMMVDPYISSVMQTGRFVFYAAEICDAVEDDALGYKINDVLVSDFVTPQWFIPGAQGPFSFKNHVDAPLKLAKGGYISIYHPVQGWTQQTNMERISYKLAPFKFSRRWQRMFLK